MAALVTASIDTAAPRTTSGGKGGGEMLFRSPFLSPLSTPMPGRSYGVLCNVRTRINHASKPVDQATLRTESCDLVTGGAANSATLQYVVLLGVKLRSSPAVLDSKKILEKVR
eukprot:scaffold118260_cov33-Tisochrysis_lutea.AAC.2